VRHATNHSTITTTFNSHSIDTGLWTCVFFTVRTISEENQPLNCPNRHLVTGLQCTGSYCDNIRLECSGILNSSIGSFNTGFREWKPYISEESPSSVYCLMKEAQEYYQELHLFTNSSQDYHAAESIVIMFLWNARPFQTMGQISIIASGLNGYPRGRRKIPYISLLTPMQSASNAVEVTAIIRDFTCVRLLMVESFPT
jgi:hypothetical protein